MTLTQVKVCHFGQYPTTADIEDTINDALMDIYNSGENNIVDRISVDNSCNIAVIQYHTDNRQDISRMTAEYNRQKEEWKRREKEE